MNRRSLLAALATLPLLPLTASAESAGTVVLHRGSERQVLAIDPATLGFRTSWQDLGDTVSFVIDAEGPDGTYSISGDAEGTRVTGAFLFAPGLPGLGNAPDPELRLQRLVRRGYELEAKGEITGAGMRITFDVVLPTMNFAPTPGPDPRP